ncbi:hypothetical protein QTP88_009929 [Uroleucon formosanum]
MGGLWSGRRVKVMWVDLFGFILILHKLNQFCSSLRWDCRFSDAMVRSTLVDIMPVSSAKVARVVFTNIIFSRIFENEGKRLIGRYEEGRFTMNKHKLFSGPDDDYGAVEMGCEIIDMPFDEYQNKKELFLKKITLKSEEIIVIERSTIGQQDNDMWQQYRKYRLTASNFGKVCKLRPTTSRANTVKHILYDIFQGSSDTRQTKDFND